MGSSPKSWRSLTTAAILVTTAMPYSRAQDPWPMWQRTPTRLGRTTSVGPRTPTIAWSVLVDPDGPSSADLSGSAVLDANGRVLVPHSRGVAAVDSRSHEVLWQFPTSDSVDGAPAIYEGRALFGSVNDFFYCVDAATGEEIWSKPAQPHPNYSPVVDSDGVVYYTSQREVMYARRVEDGELLWIAEIGNGTYSSPALDELGQVFTGSESLGDWSAHATSDAELAWRFVGGGGNFNTAPVDLNAGQYGRVYLAPRPGILYALDRLTGEEHWSYRSFQTQTGAVAVGHDGTIYLATACCDRVLIAVSPDGDELWRYEVGQGVKHPPIVDGDGVIYICALGSGGPGHVHAVQRDGTGLWVKAMPDAVLASPMLAPDGTLYVVCRDKYLYAFHDPPLGNDAAEQKQPTEIRRRPPP